MKKIYFDKLVSLVVEENAGEKKDETLVVVNWVQLYLEDGVLKEEVDNLTVKIAKEIEGKYKKNEEGKFDMEDIEKIQEEVAAAYKTKEEIKMYVGEENVLDRVNKLLAK